MTDTHEVMQAALNELDALEREQAGFDAQMAEAVRSGDDRQVFKVQRRQNDLTTLVRASRVRYLRAKIAWLEGEQAEAAAKLEPLAQAHQAANTALEEAKQTQQAAFLAWDRARVAGRNLRHELYAVVREGSVNRGWLGCSMPHS